MGLRRSRVPVGHLRHRPGLLRGLGGARRLPVLTAGGTGAALLLAACANLETVGKSPAFTPTDGAAEGTASADPVFTVTGDADFDKTGTSLAAADLDPDGTVADHMAHIGDASRRAADLVRHLLDFARKGKREHVTWRS